MNEANYQDDVVLANLPAGRTERRIALVIGLVLLGIGVVVVPFGRVRLPESDAWVPLAFSLMFAADLITWFLLISQFNIVRTRALLVLASGYLFAAAMNIPVLLTFPGVFSPTGLLGAGLQSSLWLSLWGFTGYPLAVIFYTVMKKEPRAFELHGSSRTAIAASVAIVIATTLALTWIAIAEESHLPKLVSSKTQSTVEIQYVGAVLMLLTGAALFLLWLRWRSVLDLWLMVTMCAWLAQGIAKWIHTSGRFSLSFYAGSALFVISSMVLLVVLLRETMTLYGRLAVSLVALRRLSSEKLQRSEAYLSEAQRLSHTGSFGRSLLSGEIYWSDETYRIFELDRSVKPTLELLFERIHPDDRHHVQQTIDRATNDGTDSDIECRFLRPDGSVKYLHVLARALETSSGNLEYVGAVRDVTERTLAEEALRQAKADLAHISRITTVGELAASIGHEVKQPLAAAVTNADTCVRWLTRDHPDLEEARAAAMRVVKDATRASEIISGMRLLFNKGTPERGWVDLNEVIGEMIVLLRSEAFRYDISVRTELAADLPQIMGDRVQLQQVLMNLMINGIDAMKEVDGARELTITSQRAEDEQLQVSVTDTGVGLPPQQADQIFNAFFTTKPHGTGMGLRISRSIIESHGGRLWAIGASGRGATFQFSLPAPLATHI